MTEEEFEILFLEEGIIDENRKEKIKHVLLEESVHDIKEVLKLNKVINDFEKNIIYINGNYGIGKSYKVKKAINLYCENEEDFTIFESFETGFRDNFIYILYGKVKGNKSMLQDGDMIWGKYWALILVLQTPLTLSVTKLLKLLVFPSLDGVLYNMCIVQIFITCVYITTIYLPDILTIKKDYAINYRDLYYELVLERLPKITVIDDFERLSESQQRQIYEFLSYLKTSDYFSENKDKKIIIIGALEQITGKEETHQTEKFFEKFYDVRYELDTWIDGAIFNIKHEIYNLNLDENIIPNECDFYNLKEVVLNTNRYVTRRLFVRDFLEIYIASPSGGLLKAYEQYLLLCNQKYKESTEKYESFTKESPEENGFRLELIKENFSSSLPIFNPVIAITSKEGELVFKYSKLNLSGFIEYVGNLFTLSADQSSKLLKFLSKDHQEEYLFNSLDEFKRYSSTKKNIVTLIGEQKYNNNFLNPDDAREDLEKLITNLFPKIEDDGIKIIFDKLDEVKEFNSSSFNNLIGKLDGESNQFIFKDNFLGYENLENEEKKIFSTYCISNHLSKVNRLFILYTIIDVEQYCPKMVKTNQELESLAYCKFEDVKSYKLESFFEIYPEKLFEYILDKNLTNYAHLKYIEEFIKALSEPTNLGEINGVNSETFAVVVKAVKENERKEIFKLNYDHFTEDETHFINKEVDAYVDGFEGTFLTDTIFRYLLLNNEKLSEDQKIKLYCLAPSQNGFFFADAAFKEMIDGKIGNYSLEQCHLLLYLAERNNQVSGRDNYRETINQISNRLEELKINLDTFLEGKSYKYRFEI